VFFDVARSFESWKLQGAYISLGNIDRDDMKELPYSTSNLDTETDNMALCSTRILDYHLVQ